VNAIGDLRHRLTIEQPVRTGDDGGGADVTWEAVATVWGAIDTVRGTETLKAEGLKGQLTHRIRIRHRPGLTSAMRLRKATRVFNIQALADPDGRQRWLECLCDEEPVAT